MGVVTTVDGKWMWSRLSLTTNGSPDPALGMEQGGG
jgi:hypothetical protein